MRKVLYMAIVSVLLGSAAAAQPTAPSVEIVQPEEWETVSTESTGRVVLRFESPGNGVVIGCALYLADYSDPYPYCRKDFWLTPTQVQGPGGWKLEFLRHPASDCADPDVVDLEVVRPEDGDLVTWKQVIVRVYLKLPPSTLFAIWNLHCDADGEPGYELNHSIAFYVSE